MTSLCARVAPALPSAQIVAALALLPPLKQEAWLAGCARPPCQAAQRRRPGRLANLVWERGKSATISGTADEGHRLRGRGARKGTHTMAFERHRDKNGEFEASLICAFSPGGRDFRSLGI